MSDIKTLWQSQERQTDMITLADIQTRSTRFRGRIRWRNVLLALYSLSALTVFFVWWVARGSRMPVLPALAPAIFLSALAHAWILVALWWRARSRPLPEDLAGAAALDFHRRELEHQRAAAASAWAWYILPFMPQAVVTLWLIKLHPLPKMPPEMLPVLVLLCAAFFGAIWLAFSRSAVKLELELERLKRLRAE